MKREKFSACLSGLMLAAFAALVLAGLLLGAFKSRSYLAAFAVAAAAFALYLLARERLARLARPLTGGDPARVGALLSLLCLVVNLAWVLLLRVEPTVDYKTFWLTAVDLAEGRPPALAEYLALFPHILGYSAFLSLFIRLFGASPLVAALVNVQLTVLSGALLYALLLHRRGMEAGVLASLLWTFCPSKLLYNTMVLSEPFYTCLLLLFLFLVSELDRGGHKTWAWLLLAVASGALLRGINAARPIAAIPIIAFFLWLLLLRTGKRDWGRWAAFAGLMLAVYVILGGLWGRYERQALGEEPAGTPGYSLYVGFNPRSFGSYSQEDMDLLTHYRYDVYGQAAPAQEQMLREWKDRLGSGEVNFPRLFVKKLQTFLGNDEGGAYYSRDFISPTLYSILAVLSNVFYYFLLLLALTGAFRLFRERVSCCLLIAPMYVLGLTLAHMLVEVAGRYHYSVVPMLIVTAAFSRGGRESEVRESQSQAA